MLKSMYESSNPMTDNAVREVLTGAPQNGTGHRIPDKRKKKRHLLRCRTNSEDVPVCWAAPCDIYLMLHPSGGRGTRRASHYHCRHKCLRFCANSNKFEQTACRCHHKVLAKQLLNPHSSHAWHKACHLLTLGEGKMWSIWDMAGLPDFYSGAVTSAIPGKAEQVQITCMQCKHETPSTWLGCLPD